MDHELKKKIQIGLIRSVRYIQNPNYIIIFAYHDILSRDEMLLLQVD